MAIFNQLLSFSVNCHLQSTWLSSVKKDDIGMDIVIFSQERRGWAWSSSVKKKSGWHGCLQSRLDFINIVVIEHHNVQLISVFNHLLSSKSIFSNNTVIFNQCYNENYCLQSTHISIDKSNIENVLHSLQSAW